MLVDENYLVGVISLPGGVFNPYSGVKTSILWLDKELARKTDTLIFGLNLQREDPRIHQIQELNYRSLTNLKSDWNLFL